MASGVAGVLSDGRLSPPSLLAMAWLIALCTEIASISGGSPMAFERWMVFSLFRPFAQRFTTNVSGPQNPKTPLSENYKLLLNFT